MTERALRIYNTIKSNRKILADKKRALTEYQRHRLEYDNMILLHELENERRGKVYERRNQIKKIRRKN